MQPFKKKTVNCESVKGCMFKKFFLSFWGLWRNLHRFTDSQFIFEPLHGTITSKQNKPQSQTALWGLFCLLYIYNMYIKKKFFNLRSSFLILFCTFVREFVKSKSLNTKSQR